MEYKWIALNCNLKLGAIKYIFNVNKIIVKCNKNIELPHRIGSLNLRIGVILSGARASRRYYEPKVSWVNTGGLKIISSLLFCGEAFLKTWILTADDSILKSRWNVLLAMAPSDKFIRRTGKRWMGHLWLLRSTQNGDYKIEFFTCGPTHTYICIYL